MTPIFLLSAGAAGIFGLSLAPRIRPYTRYIALAVIGFVAALILTARSAQPTATVFSLWQPSLLFGAMLTFQIGGITHPLEVALALATCGAVIVDLCSSLPARPRLTALLMLLLAAGLAALRSANALTLLVSWAMYDLLWVCSYAAAEGSPSSAIRGLILNNLATLLLWGGAMLSLRKADNEMWSLMTLGDAQWMLWGLAGVLRLAIYPVHLSAQGDPGLKSPLAAPLLLSPILGWGLWMRLASVSGEPIASGWVMWLAAVSAGVGGVAAWTCKWPGCALTWAGIGVQGAVLLAAGLGNGDVTPVILAGSVTWSLGVVALFLGRVSQKGLLWGRILSALGGLALLGLPLTPGFIVQSTLLGELTRGSRTEWGDVAVWSLGIGNLFLIPAVVRYWRASFGAAAARPFTSPESADETPDRPFLRLAHRLVWLGRAYGNEIGSALGIGLVVFWLIRTGLSPAYFSAATGSAKIYSLNALFSSPGGMGWLLWAMALVFGGLLAGWDALLRPRIEPLLSAVYDVLALEWLYDLILGALNRGLALFQAADDVIGGAGAMLWAWVIFLLFLLVRGAL